MIIRLFLFSAFILNSIWGSTQIIYTEVNPSIELCPSSTCDTNTYLIDFNNDNDPDLRLWFDSFKLGSGCESTQYVRLFSMQPRDTAELLMDSSGEMVYLDYLDTVQETDSTSFQQYYCEDSSIYDCPFLIESIRFNCESTPSVTNGHYYSFWEKYIGFKLQISGQYHYCWIKVMKTIGVNLELMGYAYNSTPNEEIVINDPNYNSTDSFDNISINLAPNPFQSNIHLELNEQNSRIKVMDIMGNLIYNRKHTAKEVDIDTGSWSHGMYIILIQSKSGMVKRRIVKN